MMVVPLIFSLNGEPDQVRLLADANTNPQEGVKNYDNCNSKKSYER